MTFWQSLKEELLEIIFGKHQLDAWCEEAVQRKIAEEIAEEYKKLYQANEKILEEIENDPQN
jgi:hypothetical protein